MKVGIIGAGAAGLAAAYELTRQGCQAEVFEQAPFVGGQASTFLVGGGRLERGYHHLFVSDQDMVELIQELGLGDKLAWLESKVGVFHRGKVWPFSTPLDLLRFRPLPFWQRVRVGLWSLALQRTRDWRKFEDITAQEWLARHMGRHACEVIWEPLLRGKFGAHFDQVSMVWLWGKFYLRVASRKGAGRREVLGYPMGSFGEVFDTLAQRVAQQGGRISLSSSVRRINVQDNAAVGLEVALPGREPEALAYDAVIATTPSYVFTQLVPPMPPAYQEKLERARYLAAVVLVLALDRPLSNIYWMNIADRQIPFVGVIEHTNLVDRSLYGGKHLVYLTNYPGRDSELYQKSGEQLLQEFIPHLRKINPEFDASWVLEHYHHRVDGAQPIVGRQYSQRIPDHRTPIRNLYLANTTQIYPEDRGTNYSVRLGRQVARLLLADQGKPWPAA
ncbi:MAG: NAD(P)/FAD-dependent oxidoreductase [SAR202 cluster bacterium]|nr:NAD(P)/FAD-dependent oxidoreductase [SAR202 cluster bacterium]